MTGTSASPRRWAASTRHDGDNRAVRIRKDRHGPAPFADRGCDLGDLLVAVGAGVPGVGDELADRPALDRVRRPGPNGRNGTGDPTGDAPGISLRDAAIRPVQADPAPG